MITHLVEPTRAARRGTVRDSVGGAPVLPAESGWPHCDCGERMALFFQFDVAARFGLPFAADSHLSVFMCPVHNDAPELLLARRLPRNYWKRRRRIDGELRFYELLLSRPGVAETAREADTYLAHRGLKFRRQNESPDQSDRRLLEHADYPGVSLSIAEPVAGRPGFKVGGQPSWAQDPETHQCCCGAEMRFLCQGPLDHPFPKMPAAPEQPDSFSRKDYCLFLGNETYIFACEAQCSPWALHPVVQN